MLRMARGDRGARGAHVGAVGQLEAFALAPDALPQHREIENFDAHGGEDYTGVCAACKPSPTGNTHFPDARVAVIHRNSQIPSNR